MGRPVRPLPDVERELDDRVEALGFEVVDLEWAGSTVRPILRLRVDRGDSKPGEGITVDDCAVVSRGLEPWLDELESVPERYVLEVSSPGIERPIRRDRDWKRFTGEKVAVRGYGKLADKATRLEGVIVGLEEGPDEEGAVRLRLHSGEEVILPREEIKGANLLYDWS